MEEMRAAPIILLGLLVVTACAFLVRVRAQTRTDSKADPKDVYQGLRDLALQSSRIKLRLPPVPTPTTPWGVIMDWGVARGTATVVAFSDGTASIYFSSGGGFIGGSESHDSIRNAAKRLVAIAAEFQLQAHPAPSYPLPERGGVVFYFLTDSGVFSAVASEDDLRKHRHALSKLGDAAQEVITQYRRAQ